MAIDAQKSILTLIENSDRAPDELFVNDLSAANHLKSFLVGGGTPVSQKVSQGVSELVSVFAYDIEQFESRIRVKYSENSEANSSQQIEANLSLWRWLKSWFK